MVTHGLGMPTQGQAWYNLYANESGTELPARNEFTPSMRFCFISNPSVGLHPS